MSLLDLKYIGAFILVLAALWLLYISSPEGYAPRRVNFAAQDQTAEFERSFSHLPQSREAYWRRTDWFNGYRTFVKTKMSQPEFDSLRLKGVPQKFFFESTPRWWRLPPGNLYRVGNGDRHLYYCYDTKNNWLYEMSAP